MGNSKTTHDGPSILRVYRACRQLSRPPHDRRRRGTRAPDDAAPTPRRLHQDVSNSFHFSHEFLWWEQGGLSNLRRRDHQGNQGHCHLDTRCAEYHRYWIWMCCSGARSSAECRDQGRSCQDSGAECRDRCGLKDNRQGRCGFCYLRSHLRLCAAPSIWKRLWKHLYVQPCLWAEVRPGDDTHKLRRRILEAQPANVIGMHGITMECFMVNVLTPEQLVAKWTTLPTISICVVLDGVVIAPINERGREKSP